MNQTDNSQTLATGWLARPQADVDVDGTVLTSPSYTVEAWLDAVVPGSVLATLVKNKKVPDPYYGDYSKSIPDIGEAGAGHYTYWFYNAFHLPAPGPGRRVELRFDGINSGATVYLNGRKLDAEAAGMFRRRVFDITAFVAGENRLAVLVTPPDPPGLTDGNGGQSGQPNIGESVVARYPVGWDWVIPMPDRSTGIWDRVSVHVSGPVVIGDPHIVTRVPGVRVPGRRQAPAYLTLTAEVTNASGAPVSGVLACAVDGRTDHASVTLAAGETRAVTFERRMDDPHLWWPNGLGRPELYPVTLTFTIGGEESDRRSFRVGVRQIDVSTMDVSADGGKRQTRVFHVNGQRVFLRGGNWIGTDAMFRYSTDAQRYRDEVRMHAEANLNLIRVWGGGIAERDPFYEACDEYGILVMQDFWISAEFDGPFSDTWTNVFRASAQDTIKRLQHHPSLLFWSGGNEQTPPGEIDDALRGWIEGPPGSGVLDGTRIYVNLSTNISGSSSKQYEDGPYGILDPADFFRVQFSNPINPELGSVGTPTFESLRLFMPEDALARFPLPRQPLNEVGEVWQLHDYIPYFNNDPAVSDQIAVYGAPDSAERFAYLAQLANYIQYRALFEGFGAHMWEWYAGVFLWKSQNPWTGLRGQLYDWYLEQTGGLFGVRRACEPVHVQLDLATNEVMVVNTSAAAFEGTATATLYDLSGRATNGGEASVPAKQPPAEPQTLFSLQNVPATPDTVYFVYLRLSNRQGEVVSTNFYWLTTGFDLRLMSPVADVGSLPTTGKDLVVVAAVNNVLHFRIFDGAGTVVDTDETKLAAQAGPIEDLRKQLEGLWPPHELARSEEDRVITAVTSIVGHTLTTGDYRPLLGLAPVKIEATGTLAQSGERWQATVTLVSAAGQAVAFWIRLQVLTSGRGERVLPVFYGDNYVSLVPGERREICMDFAAADVPSDEAPEIWLEGWNVARSQVRLTRRP